MQLKDTLGSSIPRISAPTECGVSLKQEVFMDTYPRNATGVMPKGVDEI